jgi:GNAT superfamily N-acetyltransferase
MSRTTVALTPEHLDALAGDGHAAPAVPCGRCVFWELDPVRRERASDPAAEKRAWLERVLAQWGTCGRVALVDGVPVGLLLYAPAAFVPGADGFPTAPVSADAVLLTSVHVAPGHARGGLGRMLVQGMARDLVERGGVAAVEAFGDTRGRGHRLGPGLGRCVVPAEFLGAVGFRVQRAHPTTPRLRMELRAAVSWRDEVEAVLDRLRGVVRAPVRKPAPKSARSPSRVATRTSQRVRSGPGLFGR